MRILIISAIALLSIPLIILPEDWFGWLILYLALAVPVAYRPLRETRAVLVASLSCVLLFAILAVVNSYFMILPGGGVDASRFLRQATMYSQTSSLPDYHGGSSAFVIYLSTIFSVFGPSSLSAHALSALASSLSLAAFVRLRNLLCGSKQVRPWLIIAFCVLPSALMFRSAVLREAWEGLFFISAVYYLCRLSTKTTSRSWIGFISFGLLGALLHSAFALYLLGSIVVLAMARTFTSDRPVIVRVAQLAAASMAFVPIAIAGISIAERDNRVAAVSEGFRDQSGSPTVPGFGSEGRGDATYATQPGMQGNAGTRVLAGFFYYWAAPLPWQIRGPSDLLVALENLFRVALLISGFFLYRSSSGQQRSTLFISLSSVVLLEMIWSVGTSNWGTAVRHHIPAYGVLLASAIVPVRLRWKVSHEASPKLRLSPVARVIRQQNSAGIPR